MKATLYRQNAVLARPVTASAQAHVDRDRLFLRLEHDGVEGFGEVAPQPFALNGDPGVDEVLAALATALTRVGDVLSREGALPSWSRLGGFSSGSPSENVAYAFIEMAILDRSLHEGSSSITEQWPERFDVRAQATVSLLDESRDWSIDDGVARVRVKCAPGAISARALERLSELRVPVILDYNCVATADDEVLEQLEIVQSVALVEAVEQPYAAGNVVDHARLALRLPVALSIDEGLRSERDLKHLVNYGAATMVCVKPARVGGLAKARTLITKAQSLGVAAYLGGFFESPYARSVHRALVAHCVSEPSDVDAVALVGDAEETTRIDGGFGLTPSTALLASMSAQSVFGAVGS